MYGLPSDFDPSRFLGRTLDLVSFSVSTVSLRFDGGISITIESCFAHATGQPIVEAERTSIPVRDSRLMQIPGETVIDAKATSDGTLTLVFTGDHVLAIFDDDPMYEAYNITIGDEEIIV
jgi:hypothetical protein